MSSKEKGVVNSPLRLIINYNPFIPFRIIAHFYFSIHVVASAVAGIVMSGKCIGSGYFSFFTINNRGAQ